LGLTAIAVRQIASNAVDRRVDGSHWCEFGSLHGSEYVADLALEGLLPVRV
jgi:hypothetical protein